MRVLFSATVMVAMAIPAALWATTPPRPGTPPGPGGSPLPDERVPQGPPGRPGFDRDPTPGAPGALPDPLAGRGPGWKDIQVSTGPFSATVSLPSEGNGAAGGGGTTDPSGPGLCFDIMAGKGPGSAKLGEMCSFGSRVAAGMTPLSETFWWNVPAQSWKQSSFYLKLNRNVVASTYTGPAGKLKQVYANPDDCTRGAGSPGTTDRYKVTGADGLEIMVAPKVKGDKAALIGYWKTTTCVAVAVASDDFITFTRVPDGAPQPFTAGAFGTAN